MSRIIKTEVGKKISQALTGRKLSPEHVQKLKDRILPSGNKSHAWKEAGYGYSAVHVWITKNLGRPSKCEFCGTIESKKFEWANISGEYKRNFSDWKRLCKKCHVKYDIKGKCRNGHLFLPENTYFNTRRHRVCRTCRKIYLTAYFERKNHVSI